MTDGLKDLFIRAFAAALVSAVIAGGLIYFAFDQSLRGLETALITNTDVLSDRIDDTNALIAVNRDGISENRQAIANLQQVMLQEFSNLNIILSDNAANERIRLFQRDQMFESLIANATHQHELINAIKLSDVIEDPDAEDQLNRISLELEAQIATLKRFADQLSSTQ